MEDTNKKIDELAALVKENTSSINELATLVKSGFIKLIFLLRN
jgi:hypothetical protein